MKARDALPPALPDAYGASVRKRLHFLIPLLFYHLGLQAAQMPAGHSYVDSFGVFEVEAENYHNRSMGGTRWEVISTGSPGAYQNALNGEYVQALPDTGTQGTWTAGPRIDYLFEIDTPGTYQLSTRWTGGGSAGRDSFFIGVLELSDGAAGAPDWFEDSSYSGLDFPVFGWDEFGGAEQNQSAASQNPMQLFFPTAGQYTMRMVMREDGVAVDAWRLELLESTPGAHPDTANMRAGQSARLFLTDNDGGNLDTSTLEILSQPEHGTVENFGDGSIRYNHDGGLSLSDSFSYRIQHATSGIYYGPATVDITITANTRFENHYHRLPQTPPETNFQLKEAFPGVTFSSPHGISSIPGDSEKLFIAEGDGRVWLIPDVSAANPQKTLYLDISSIVKNNGNEVAMKGVAAHPDYANNGYLYVTYHLDAGAGDANRPRLSRFKRSTANPLQADPSTELVLIDQTTPGFFHSVASCKFGPDGYLYVGYGDEGTQIDGYGNAQRIDKDIWSCIIRIDVDKLPGNLEPNAHPDIPTDPVSGLAGFSIPADNPFVGISSFNSQPLADEFGDPLPGVVVRTEIYAMGFRNPWQFTFVPESDALLVADVGRYQWEEISLIPKGGNAGWSWYEGQQPGPRTGTTINGAAETDANITMPLYTYSHDVGSSVTGGLIYQGLNYPDLAGLYIFADYVSGSIWSLDYSNATQEPVYLQGESAIVAFILDPSNDDILMLDRGQVGSTPGVGRILRLTNGLPQDEFPTTLSAANFFVDIESLTPNPGGEWYEPILRFWSDFAEKKRWFSIPDVNAAMTFTKDSTWSFPTGMVWVKHFDLEMVRGDPTTKRKVETRFLVKTDDGAYGVSYRWNNEETEAYLAPNGGATINYQVMVDGSPYQQSWHIPSRNDCRVCHTESAGHALSFNTRQLNHDGALAGGYGNVLSLLKNAGYLDGLLENPIELPKHVRPDQIQYSVESRARAYLAVNCAYCHHDGGATPASWDGRPSLTLFETMMVNGVPEDEPLDPSHRLLVPGNINASIIWNRMSAANEYSRMPPLATSEIDMEGSALIAEWINDRLPNREDYEMWRTRLFTGEAINVSAPELNADMDPYDNWTEFLWKTDPLNASTIPTPTIHVANGLVTITRPGLEGRSIRIERSNDLGISDPWKIWDNELNSSISLLDGTEIDVSEPLIDPKAFFRYRISEE